MKKLLLALLLITTTHSHAGSVQVAEAEAAFVEANTLCLKSTQEVKEATRIFEEEKHVAKALAEVYKDAKFLPPQAQLAFNRAMVAYEQVVRADAKSEYACNKAESAFNKLEAAEQRID